MRKHSAIKWTKEIAASEFNINPRTLTNRLRQLDINPDKDGAFSTLQICSAVFGDYESERLRLTKEQADKLALENQQSRKELINVNDLADNLTKFISAARQRVLSNLKLDEDEKDKILSELGQCLDSVAHVGGTDSTAV
jgi:phage terminase Nu1 subunit (DNA packaging protein)